MNLKYYNGLTIIPTFVLKLSPLITEGFVFALESIMRSVKSGYDVIELEFPLRARVNGKSKAFTFRSFYMIWKDILRVIIYAKNKV